MTYIKENYYPLIMQCVVYNYCSILNHHVVEEQVTGYSFGMTWH